MRNYAIASVNGLIAGLFLAMAVMGGGSSLASMAAASTFSVLFAVIASSAYFDAYRAAAQAANILLAALVAIAFAAILWTAGTAAISVTHVVLALLYLALFLSNALFLRRARIAT